MISRSKAACGENSFHWHLLGQVFRPAVHFMPLACINLVRSTVYWVHYIIILRLIQEIYYVVTLLFSH